MYGIIIYIVEKNGMTSGITPLKIIKLFIECYSYINNI